VIDADLAPELGGAPFLVMELLEGADLERAAAAALPTPATVVEWLRQVARALDRAHHLGMVHRDLKPENLFLTTKEDGAPLVKILDFGIVKMVEEATAATSTGQILGTPKYMAPEQATANASVTPATDRCALGLIAYRLLTGESYYQGGVMVILGQLLHGELQPPSERGSRLGAAFDAWFLKACHHDPGKRFASAAEQIEALAESLGIHDAAIGPTRETSSRLDARPGARRARRVVLAEAAIATVLVAAGITGRLATTGKREQAGICGLPSVGATENCGPCMAEACCNEAEECSRIEGCAPLEACIRACGSGDTMCGSRCYAAAGPAADF
jgi:Protein kinase domain